MTDKLPKKCMDEWTALAKGAHFLGYPLEDYSREELLAIAAAGWSAEKRAREEAIKQFEFGRTLGAARLRA